MSCKSLQTLLLEPIFWKTSQEPNATRCHRSVSKSQQIRDVRQPPVQVASQRRAGTRRTSVGWPDMPASHLPCSHNPGKAVLPPPGIPTWPRSVVTAQACCYLPNRCIYSPESLPRLIWLAVPKRRAPSPAKTTLSSFRQQFLKAFWQGREGGGMAGFPPRCPAGMAMESNPCTPLWRCCKQDLAQEWMYSLQRCLASSKFASQHMAKLSRNKLTIWQPPN